MLTTKNLIKSDNEINKKTEKKIVCLRDRDYFIDQYEFLVKDEEI